MLIAELKLEVQIGQIVMFIDWLKEKTSENISKIFSVEEIEEYLTKLDSNVKNSWGLWHGWLECRARGLARGWMA